MYVPVLIYDSSSSTHAAMAMAKVLDAVGLCHQELELQGRMSGGTTGRVTLPRRREAVWLGWGRWTRSLGKVRFDAGGAKYEVDAVWCSTGLNSSWSSVVIPNRFMYATAKTRRSIIGYL